MLIKDAYVVKILYFFLQSRSKSLHSLVPILYLLGTLQWSATYTFGSGSEAVQVNSWDGMVDNYSYSMQTTVNDCTPVALTVYGISPEGTYTFSLLIFI